MNKRGWIRIGLAALALGALAPGGARAAEIRVMSSAGFKPAYLDLLAVFERESGHTVANAWGPSMGATPQAVPNRLARGEPVDVVIGVKAALVALGRDGKLLDASRADLARSLVGMAVKAGASKPDISSVEAFKAAVLAAPSIAYSDSASGVYLERTLFPRLGLWDAIKEKSRMIPADPVGESVAHGEAAIGFQQIAELKAVPGIDVVGPIPAELQTVTVYSASLAPGAPQPEAGRALIAFLSSPRAADAIRRSGMEPIGRE